MQWQWLFISFLLSSLLPCLYIAACHLLLLLPFFFFFFFHIFAARYDPPSAAAPAPFNTNTISSSQQYVVDGKIRSATAVAISREIQYELSCFHLFHPLLYIFHFPVTTTTTILHRRHLLYTLNQRQIPFLSSPLLCSLI